jgi:amidohydrolase
MATNDPVIAGSLALHDVAQGVARTVGCYAEVSIDHGEPALVNDPDIAARARQQLAVLGLTPQADLISCGADDFAYFSEQVASLLMFVGTGERAGQLVITR